MIVESLGHVLPDFFNFIQPLQSDSYKGLSSFIENCFKEIKISGGLNVWHL